MRGQSYCCLPNVTSLDRGPHLYAENSYRHIGVSWQRTQ